MNPKRGALFFLISFFILIPLSLILRGSSLPLDDLLVGIFLLSALIGILATFTRHVDFTL